MPSEVLFPQFSQFVRDHRLLETASGSLAAKLPRILGQGKTRADGLDLPPAPIERQQELVSLALPKDIRVPPGVSEEIAEAKQCIDDVLKPLERSEGVRRFATQVLRALEDIPTGNKDNHFYAGRLVLVSDKAGQNWSWCLTPHYPIVSKIPPDVEYVVRAHAAAEATIEKTTLSVERFQDRLALAWSMAQHFSAGEDVLISDVARMYRVAAQDDRFWNRPAKRSFVDVPDGAFIANLIHWRRNRPDVPTGQQFEFVPATLNQAHGPKAKAFFMPVNAEGTQVRPVIYLRRANK